METKDKRQTHDWENWPHRPNRLGRVMSGLIVVGVGVVLLARKMGVLIPDWVFTWEMLLIVLGLFIGAKHSFRRWGWLIPIVVGGVFLSERMIPGLSIKIYFAPILIILAGLFIMFRPQRRCRGGRWKRWEEAQERFNAANPGGTPETTVADDKIDIVCVFGGVKKNIISKNFKGGDIVCVFGGAEVNLSQAELSGTQVLDISQFFGGIKLVVPSHWKIQPEASAIFGGFEDKRDQTDNTDHTKVLVIQGTSVFGGVSIQSF